MNQSEVTVMDTTVESKCVDISDREIVVFVMEIGEQRRGRMIHNVDPVARGRVALRERCTCLTFINSSQLFRSFLPFELGR